MPGSAGTSLPTRGYCTVFHNVIDLRCNLPPIFEKGCQGEQPLTNLYWLKAETHVVQPSQGYSSFFGIILVGLGALMGLLAFVRYKKIEKQIDEDTYQPSWILDILLTISILAVGIFLVVYLIHNTSGFLVS
jgi:hypothetical protein